MLNPCTQLVLDLFASLGRGTPRLISESRNEDSFGSGGTTLELDGLRLHVVNDRAIETVEVGLENVGESLDIHPALNDYKDEMGQPTCPLEFLAVMKGWVSMDEWLRHYQLAGDPVQYDAETPPPGPYYELAEAISLLKDGAKWNELIAISSIHSLQLEAGSVAESLQREFEARLVRSK